MATPVETVADALFSFILSLLRDPVAAKEFTAEPQATLANHGLGNVCQADVAAVKPVIVDHPSVVYVPSPAPAPQPSYRPPAPEHHDPVQEIVRMVQHFTTVDARSTIVDQSVNQNIWAQGDVMQIFDNEAVLATGAGSTAAGNDIIHDSSQDSSTTIVAGGDAVVDNDIDVSTVDGSYNTATDATTTDNSVDVSLTDVQITPAPEPEPAPAVMDATESASDDAPADAGLLPEPEPIDESFDADEY